jgi:hypothetical protein
MLRGKSLLILLLTLAALGLLVWEIVFSFSAADKAQKAKAEKAKAIAPNPEPSNNTVWKHYVIVKRSPADSAIEKIVSSYPGGDTIYPVDSSPEKRLRLFEDTLRKNRICIFRPTSPDGKYGDWIILTDSTKIITKFNAVAIDSMHLVAGNRKVIFLKKQNKSIMVKDTVAP